jgi:hypothetical protein
MTLTPLIAVQILRNEIFRNNPPTSFIGDPASCLIAARLILLRLPLPTGLLKKRYIVFWDEETVLHPRNQVIVLGLQ